METKFKVLLFLKIQKMMFLVCCPSVRIILCCWCFWVFCSLWKSQKVTRTQYYLWSLKGFEKKKKYIPSVSIICDVILVEPFYVKQTNKKASKVPADNIPIQLHVCEICCISLGGHTWQLLGLPRAMKK